MNAIKLVTFVPAFVALFSALPVSAQELDTPPAAGGGRTHPIQLSLWDTVQTSDQRDSIHGVRLNLPYGSNRDVYGLDIGIANRTTRDVHGVQFGLGGYVERNMLGAQMNFVLSIARGEVMGLQEGVYTSADKLYGVQGGAVNHVENGAYGARFALVNVSDTFTEGAEFGIVNYARKSRGLQLGIVNVTEELHGVQIGVVNVAKNGFLPFFPVVNAAL